MVNWNGAAFLDDLFASIQAENPAEMILIDNNSSDSSGEILAHHPTVRTIYNKENLGFGAAANQGIEATTAPFILVINVDLKVKPGSLEILEGCLVDHSDVAVAAPQLISTDGSLQPSVRSFPTVARIFLYLSYLDHIIPSVYRVKREDHEHILQAEQPMGAALLFRRSALQKTGLFDPQFFMYMEEVDLCERLVRAGWKILFLPDAKIVHHAGGSSNQDWERTQWNYLESVLKYFRKRSSPFQLALLRAGIPFALLLRSVAMLLRGWFRRARFYFRAAFRFPFLRPL